MQNITTSNWKEQFCLTGKEKIPLLAFSCVCLVQDNNNTLTTFREQNPPELILLRVSPTATTAETSSLSLQKPLDRSSVFASERRQWRQQETPCPSWWRQSAPVHQETLEFQVYKILFLFRNETMIKQSLVFVCHFVCHSLHPILSLTVLESKYLAEGLL